MISFCRARPDQVEDLAALIQGSYRTRASWTHECELLEGERISRQELLRVVTESHLETARSQDGELLGCVQLDRNDRGMASLGLLSVLPSRQGQGLGKRLLDRARDWAREQDLDILSLTVLRQRSELVAYYQRRGFQLSGRTFAFPSGGVGRPLRPDLELIEMVLPLTEP